MARQREAVPHKRDGYWCLVRRVPTRFAKLDRRCPVCLSTGIRVGDDPRGVVARKVVARLDEELQRYWRELEAGKNPEAIKRAKWAVETVKQFKMPYSELEQIDVGPLVDVIQRCFAVEKMKEEERKKVLPALWGHYKKPEDSTLISDMPEIVEEIQAVTLRVKSPEQRRKWRATRDRAVARFVKIVGDRKLVDLTVDDVEAYRDYWKQRVLREEVEPDTANKYIERIAAMYREISRERRLRLPDVFTEMKIKGGEEESRPPFETAYVQNVLLADGVMDGLNDEARAIFYVVAETGMRPSEVAGLRQKAICLDHDVPHVKLVEDGRALKNKPSIRSMPLVGIALEVMKFFPDGFPNYRDRTSTLSNTINKYLREHKLCPTEEHSFYSLRHTYKDRLRKADGDSELRDLLMGHSTKREKYGDGHELQRKQQVLLRMAFKPPRLTFAEAGVRELKDHLGERARQLPRAAGRFSDIEGRGGPTIRRRPLKPVPGSQEGSVLRKVGS